MKRIKLTKEEKAIENALLKGEYKKMPKSESDAIIKALKRARKDFKQGKYYTPEEVFKTSKKKKS